jgi:two-component sensor histidine kinase
MFCLVICFEASSQASIQSANSSYTYHPPSSDKDSWQRLNLFLSSTYFQVVKEGQVDLDSSLIYASHSLGMSRLTILTEGIDDPGLLASSQWVDQNNPSTGIRLLSEFKGRMYLEQLVLLGAYYAFHPKGYSRYKDSVEYFVSKAVNESGTLNEEKLERQALCVLVKIYAQANNLKQEDSVFNRLLHECQAADDLETEARAFMYRGLYTPFSPATTQGRITDLQKAVALYLKSGNAEGQINAYTDIGYLQVVSGQIQKAYEAFLKAYQLEEENKYPYVHYNADAIAMITTRQGKFGEPLRYTIESIKSAETSRDSIGWAYFYFRLSSLYKSEGSREKESEEWLEKAMNRFLQDKNPAIYNAISDKIDRMDNAGLKYEALAFVQRIGAQVPPANFTEQLFYNFALATCYTNLKQFELAKSYLSKADAMETQAEAFRGPLRRPQINNQYGFLYFYEGKYREAKSYFEKNLVSANLWGLNLSNSIQADLKLIRIDSILNDPVSGVTHYKLYTQLIDSNFSVSKIRQAEELQVLYQTQEKENQISLLNQQTKLEQANLKQATLVKNLTIAGIVAVLIIAVLLYRQSSLRKKNNNVITHKNEKLQHLLTEKEWLLKEIHHRVKNNLQIVMSLLNSQSAYIDNDAALTAIHDSQHRVHAMSLIHQKLYSSENVSSIDVQLYIRELVSYLADSFDTGQRIKFDLNIEPLKLDVSQAVPLGLILNEAITNSIKYAFPHEQIGTISISFLKNNSDQNLLSISDNGVGMPATIKKTGSLGMSLIKGLSEDLDGNLSIENNNGTTIKILFVHETGVKSPGMSTASFVSNN